MIPSPDAVRFPYKVFSVPQRTRAFPDSKSTWLPVLAVSLIINDRITKRFEAIVDSGAANCLFHASIAEACAEAELSEAGYVRWMIGGSKGSVFFHEAKLFVPGGGSAIKITAGFSPQLSVGALLGRHGFFEHFTITFDSCVSIPSLVLEHFYRS